MASSSWSPTWMVSPPIRPGSTFGPQLDASEPAIASTRARTAAASSSVSGAALVTIAMTMPRCALSRRRYSSLTRGSRRDPAALDEQVDEPQGAGWIRAARAAARHGQRAARRRHGRVVDDRRDLGPPRMSAASRRSSRQRSSWSVSSATCEGGLGVAAGGGDRARHQLADLRPPVGESREEVGDQSALAVAGHRLADHATGGREREVGRPRTRSSAIARCFSASISAAARSRIRSSSSRVAAMSCSRLSARDPLGAVDDVVRLAAGLLERGERAPARPTRGRGAPARRRAAPPRCAIAVPRASSRSARTRTAGATTNSRTKLSSGDDQPEPVDHEPGHAALRR